MPIAMILELIAGVTQVARAVGPLVAEVKDSLSSDDEAKLKAALAELQASNDQIYDRVQAKLRG